MVASVVTAAAAASSLLRAASPLAASMISSQLPPAGIIRGAPEKSWPSECADLDLRAAIRLAEAYVRAVPSNACDVAQQATHDVRAQIEVALEASDALDAALESPRSWGGWLMSWVVAPRNIDHRYSAVMRSSVVLEKRMQRLLSVVRAPPGSIEYKVAPGRSGVLDGTTDLAAETHQRQNRQNALGGVRL